jgi:hypothetical protein
MPQRAAEQKSGNATYPVTDAVSNDSGQYANPSYKAIPS